MDITIDWVFWAFAVWDLLMFFAMCVILVIMIKVLRVLKDILIVLKKEKLD